MAKAEAPKTETPKHTRFQRIKGFFKELRTNSTKRYIFIGVSLVLITLIGGCNYVVFGSYSEGYRVGTVMKLSKKGVLFKTYEGELNQEITGRNSDGELAPRIWEFSVARGDEEVRKAIDDAVINGYRVKLLYNEKFYRLSWIGETKYFVYKVERITKTEN